MKKSLGFCCLMAALLAGADARAEEAMLWLSGESAPSKVADISFSSGGFNFKTSAILSGDWTYDQYYKLVDSLKPDSQLELLDASNMHLVGDRFDFGISNCKELKVVKLPTIDTDRPARIGFSKCMSLNSIENLEKYSNIDSYVNSFEHCNSLTSITGAKRYFCMSHTAGE